MHRMASTLVTRRFYRPAPSDDTIAQWVEDAVARRDGADPAIGSTRDLMVNNRSCE